MPAALEGVPSPALVREVVSGRLGTTAAAQLLGDPLGHGAAEALAPGLLGEVHNTPELVRSKFKPGRRLTGYYRLGPAESPTERHLAVYWHSGPIGPGAEPSPHWPPPLIPPCLSWPGSATQVTSPGWPLTSRDGPARVGALACQHDSLPAEPATRAACQRRTGELDMIVKTDRDVSGARAAYVARSLGVLLSERCPGAVVAEPLGFSARDGASLWHHAQGTPLSELITRDPVGAELPVALVGRALRVLHDHALASRSLGVSEVLGTHDVTAEAAATLRAGEHIRVLLPAVGRAYDTLVATSIRSSQRGTTQGLTFLHGDLKSDNLLVDGEQVRILDLDRCSRGDPALDLGKFLADLCWWSRPGSRGPPTSPGPFVTRTARPLTTAGAVPRYSPRCSSSSSRHAGMPCTTRCGHPGPRPGGGRGHDTRRCVGCAMTTSLDLDARAATWLAELDPALAQLAHALPPVSAGGQWLLHDARWTPGQGCRLAYRSPASASAPVFLDVNVTPSGWAHRDYRDDDMLPGLASATDPAAVAALLGTLDGEVVEQCWVEPVRYRPASRCVLRYRVRTASRETALFAKVFQAGEFAALSPVITSLADRAGVPELVPEVVALWPQLQAVLVRAVPGRSASSVLSDPRVPAAERLAVARRVGRLLAQFHQQSGIEAPSWSAADQLAGLADSMAAADCAEGRLAAHYRSVLELLAVAPPAETHPVLAHGAFRAGQVVLGDDGHLTALDIDGICHSDRGRDLGNVLAYLMWQGVRQPQQRHAMEAAGRAILSAYEEVAGPLDEPSLDWWRAAGLLQVAARRFRRLETRDWTLTPILVERAAELLRPPRTRQAPHAAADLLDPRWMSGVLRVALAPAQRSADPLQVETAEPLSPSSGRRP